MGSIEQKLRLFYSFLMVIYGIDSLSSRYFSKLSFGYVGILCVLFSGLEAAVKIIPEVMQGNNLSVIVESNTKVVYSLIPFIFVVMLFGITSLFIYIDRKLNH